MVRDAATAVAVEERSTPASEPMLEEWERREETRILEAKEVPETDRLAIVPARRGQGIFRANVREVETLIRCEQWS